MHTICLKFDVTATYVDKATNQSVGNCELARAYLFQYNNVNLLPHYLLYTMSGIVNACTERLKNKLKYFTDTRNEPRAS